MTSAPFILLYPFITNTVRSTAIFRGRAGILLGLFAPPFGKVYSRVYTSVLAGRDMGHTVSGRCGNACVQFAQTGPNNVPGRGEEESCN